MTQIRILTLKLIPEEDEIAGEVAGKMDQSELAVNVQGVYKSYGRGKKATHVLKGLTMEVPYYTM